MYADGGFFLFIVVFLVALIWRRSSKTSCVRQYDITMRNKKKTPTDDETPFAVAVKNRLRTVLKSVVISAGR